MASLDIPAAVFPGGIVPDAGALEQWLALGGFKASSGTSCSEARARFTFDELDDAERGVLFAICAGGGGYRPNPTDSKGRQYAIQWPTEGSKKTIISHRFNDPTTWAEQSVEVIAETAAAHVAGSEYDLPDSNLIDTAHGKIFGEDSLGKRVLVEVDTGSGFEVKTEKDAHTGAGDFELDYSTGRLTFDPAIPGDATVRASYWKAGGSTYTIKPTAGKRLIIDSAEVQFAQDTELSDSVRFLVFGLADVFAPSLLTTADPPGPIPPGTLIELKRTIYKTLANFIDESNGANPVVPAFPSSIAPWRGTDQPITVFPWDYQAALEISSAAGMEIRIDLEHDEPFGGSYATCTLYCLSEDE